MGSDYFDGELMVPNYGCDNKDAGSGQLLRDIEEISKALYMTKYPPTRLNPPAPSRSKSIDTAHIPHSMSVSASKSTSSGEGCSRKVKKSSVWQWKPLKLKPFSILRRRKFSCCFFCHVHSIENLPADFSEFRLVVNWKRKDHVMRTRPLNVSNGIVEFEETLMNRCSIYGVKDGPENLVRYDPKHCLLYVSIAGAYGLDLGRNWVDLARLLPLTFKELEGDKRSGKWTTSLNLAGRAEGATLQVSFGYMLVNDDLGELSGYVNFPQIMNSNQTRSGTLDSVASYGSRTSNLLLRRVYSLPGSSAHGSTNSSQSSESNFLRAGSPRHGSELSDSINVLYQKLDEENGSGIGDSNIVSRPSLNSRPALHLDSGNESHRTDDVIEFTVIDKGIEYEWTEETRESDDCTDKHLDISEIDVTNVAEIFKGEGLAFETDVKETTPGEAAALSGRTPSAFAEKTKLDEMSELPCCTPSASVEETEQDEIAKLSGLTSSPPADETKLDEIGELSGFGCTPTASIEETNLHEIGELSGLTPSASAKLTKCDEIAVLPGKKAHTSEEEHSYSCTAEPNVADLELKFHNMSISDSAGLHFSFSSKKVLEENPSEEVNLKLEPGRLSRSLSFDDAVTDEFLNMLQEEHTITDSEYESPKEHLWRQFEVEMQAAGSMLFDIGQERDETVLTPADSFFLSNVDDVYLQPSTRSGSAPVQREMKAQLELLETQTLMERWGMNDDAFSSSTFDSTAGFGSPVSVADEETSD